MLKKFVSGESPSSVSFLLESVSTVTDCSNAISYPICINSTCIPLKRLTFFLVTSTSEAMPVLELVTIRQAGNPRPHGDAILLDDEHYAHHQLTILSGPKLRLHIVDKTKRC